MTQPELEFELPDGTRMSFPAGPTPRKVAEAIGPGLAKAALAAKLDGEWVDLRAPLESRAPPGASRLPESVADVHFLDPHITRC